MATWSRQTGWVQVENSHVLRRVETPSLLSLMEQLEYERLCAWFLAWRPPAEPYALGPHRTVADPARCHMYYAQRVGTMRGQQQRAFLAFMRAHWAKFGGKGDGES